MIYFSSEQEVKERSNDYGYYAGKVLKHQDMHYPASDGKIVERTKRYMSAKRAENAAISVFEKCDYVKSWEVREV